MESNYTISSNLFVIFNVFRRIANSHSDYDIDYKWKMKNRAAKDMRRKEEKNESE